MKKYLIILSLILCLSNLSYGQKNSLRFYPARFAAGKFYYCSDILFSYERKIKDQHRLEIGFQGSIPNPFVLLPSTIAEGTGLAQGINLMAGVGGFISYKYQLPNKKFYIGSSLSSVYYNSIKSTHDVYSDQRDEFSSYSENYHIKMYMNNVNFLLGWNISKKQDLDIALNIGYRFNRAYYIFDNRTEEMPHYYTNVYSYIRFPLRFGVDLSLNISSIYRSKHPKKTD